MAHCPLPKVAPEGSQRGWGTSTSVYEEERRAGEGSLQGGWGVDHPGMNPLEDRKSPLGAALRSQAEELEG